ncbi:hypothetical protein B0T20DRAFT_468957 [Sordaria brevicollis]|uniref:SCA7 domain-containing protein n=1 Tax=Sordaria brevicollis TaxID=83679 RepID=A0AAE0PG94_SORBR|nr:hypothetical protein B0T20DRAFT_468957 [Sordaria brevicollis]
MATVESRKDDEANTIKVASSKPIRNITKLKRQPSKASNTPGNWKFTTAALENEEKKKAKEAGNAGPPSPIINQLDPPALVTFETGRPLDDVPDLIYCKLCKKGVIRTSGKEHIDECLRIKREKAQRKKEAREARERAKEAAREEEARKNNPDGDAHDEDDSDADEPTERKGNSGKTTKKATGKKPDTGGKKRKAEGDLEKGKAKKKKDEPKPKTAKPKGPVDVERQCGVILPNGQPCARSLTCKSHSMSAKRSVPGRSLPYDMLLVAYQKKNQAKQQRAAIDANAPLEDDDDPNAGAVDSDEETAAVMNALANWRPQPVVPQPVIAPIKRQYQLARLHEQLQTVTNGGRLNIFKVVGYGAQKLPEGHPGLYQHEEEPAADPDVSMQDAFSRRSSTFNTAVTDTSAPKKKRQSEQLEEEPQRKRVRLDPGSDSNPRLSPKKKKPVQRPVPQHASPAMEGQKMPRRPSETTHQYLKQTFALNRRHDTVRSPLPADSPRPSHRTSPYKPPSQANPTPMPPRRDADRGVARPRTKIHHNSKSPARKGPAEVSIRGGGSEVGSPTRNNSMSSAAARTPARHPNRRLSSASPSQTYLDPHISDEVRKMDAEVFPGVSPEEMDMTRQLFYACQQYPEMYEEYHQQYAIWQQQWRARKGLSGGKSPVRPQFANVMPPAFTKPEIHEAQRRLGQAQFRPAFLPQHGHRAIIRSGITSPLNTPGAVRGRPVQPSPDFRNQHTLPDTPQTGGNHQRKRSGLVPKIKLKVPKPTQQPNEGGLPVKAGHEDVMRSPSKTHRAVGGKTLEDPPVDGEGVVVIDD